MLNGQYSHNIIVMDVIIKINQSINLFMLERFSIECRKTKTKVITTAN